MQTIRKIFGNKTSGEKNEIPQSIKNYTQNNIKNSLGKIKNKLIHGEEGMGVVEVILIIVVLIGIASVFKTEINGVVKTIFITIKSQVGSF